MTIPITQCYYCKWYEELSKCKAFPKKIPEKILFGEFDHTKPYKGDKGIRFEPIKKYRFEPIKK
jgi:hypothetical protein